MYHLHYENFLKIISFNSGHQQNVNVFARKNLVVTYEESGTRKHVVVNANKLHAAKDRLKTQLHAFV